MAQDNLDTIDDSWDETASGRAGSESEDLPSEEPSKAAPADDAKTAAVEVDVDLGADDSAAPAAPLDASSDDVVDAKPETVDAKTDDLDPKRDAIDATAAGTDVVAETPQALEAKPETVEAKADDVDAAPDAPSPGDSAGLEALMARAPAARTRSTELFAELAPKRASEDESAHRPERLGDALGLIRATRSNRSIPPPPSKAPPPPALVTPPAAPAPTPSQRAAPPPPPSARAASAPSLAAEPTAPPAEGSAPAAAFDVQASTAAPHAPLANDADSDDDRETPAPPPPQAAKALPALPALPPLPALPSSPSTSTSLPPASASSLRAAPLPPMPKLPRLSSFAPSSDGPAHRRTPSLEPVVTPTPLLSRSRARIVAAAAGVVALVVAIAVVISLASRNEGALLATVAGPGNVPVDSLKLYVDGKLVCERSPCRVDDLARGTHFVRVDARGYMRTADRAIIVVSGEESVLNFALSREAREAQEPVAQAAATATPERTSDEPAANVESRSTRRARSGAARAVAPRAAVAAAAPAGGKGTLSISANAPVNVVVDGRPLGKAPQSVRVAAGKHTVMFAGEQGRRVQVIDVGPGENKAVAAKF